MATTSRKEHVLPIAIITLVIAAVSVVVALTIDWLPDPAAKEADRVDLLIWWTVWASIGIFAVVMGFMFYSIWKFRARDGDESDGPPIHGHTGLEIVWTANVKGFGVGQNALDHACQRRASPKFNKFIRAQSLQAQHTFNPTHAVCDLLGQQFW